MAVLDEYWNVISSRKKKVKKKKTEKTNIGRAIWYIWPKEEQYSLWKWKIIKEDGKSFTVEVKNVKGEEKIEEIDKNKIKYD